jgi:hypothetical protein
MSSSNLEALKAHILPLSRSRNFDIARGEWSLYHVEISEEMDHCPCGQEIKEHCYIENKVTGHRTHVGNVCINRFMGIDTSTLFDGLKRIAKDHSANPNEALVDFAWKKGYLYDEREYEFIQQMCRKRKRSEAQNSWVAKINRRIVNKIVVKKRSTIEELTE